MGYRIINGKAYQVGNIQSLSTEQNKTKSNQEVGNSFKSVLDKAIKEKEGYTLSKHAIERLEEINFTANDMNAIERGFKLAEEKGAKNSAIIYKDITLIASIENKTVITAVEKERAKENVFTNIDSVVIL